jgi:hypothetical protein
MSPEVTTETPDSAFFTMRKLRLDLLVLGPVDQWPTGEVQLKKNVPRLFADFLIECLATEPLEPHRTPKNVEQQVKVWLKVPVPLPVLFEPSEKPNCRLLSFADTPLVSAKEIWDQVNCVLNKLNRERIVALRVSDFSRACSGFGMEELDALAVRENVDILKGPEILSEKSASFVLYVRGDLAGGARSRLSASFEKGKLRRCKHCDGLFDISAPEGCQERRLGTLRVQKKDSVHEAPPTATVSKLDIQEMTIGEAANFV